MKSIQCVVYGLGAAGVLSSQTLGQTTNWLEAVSGAWSDPERWSGGVPADMSHVVIDATGAAYTSEVDTGFIVSSITMDSTDATLLIDSGFLTVDGLFDVRAGRVVFDSGQLFGGTLNISDSASVAFRSSGTLDSVTVNGNIDLEGTGTSLLLRNTIVDGSLRFIGLASGIRFDAPASFNGSIIDQQNAFEFGKVDTFSDLVFEAQSTVTARRLRFSGFESDFTSRGMISTDASTESSVTFAGFREFTNDGSIKVSANGEASVNADVGRFVNSGTVDVASGGAFFTFSPDFVNAGTINVDGEFILDGFTTTDALGLAGGRITGSADSILRIGGILDNTGSVISTADFAGEIRFGDKVFSSSPGVVRGGAIINATDTPFDLSRSLLDGVDLIGDFSALGLVLQNNVSVSGDLRFDFLEFSSDGTLEGSIIANDGGTIELPNFATVTLASGSTLSGSAVNIESFRVISANGARFINDGDISVVDGSSEQPSFIDKLELFENNGSISVTEGGQFSIRDQIDTFANNGTITLGHATAEIEAREWSNTGAITLTNSLLTIGGRLSIASLQNVAGDADSTLVLSGVIDSGDTEFGVDDFEGAIVGNNLGVIGGTFDAEAIGITFQAQSTNSFTRVDFLGDLNIDGLGTTMRFIEGTTVEGRVNLNADSSTLEFVGTQAFDGQVMEAAPGGATVSISGNGSVVTLGANGSIVGSDLTIMADPNAGLVNLGTISTHAAPGGLLRFGGGNVENDGVIEGSAESTVQLFSDLSNEGTIRVGEGGLLDVRSFTNAGDLIVNNAVLTTGISSTWSNDATGRILADNATIAFEGEWINRGTVSARNATVHLGGVFSTEDSGLASGRFDLTGSQVTVAGAVDNVGSVLSTGILGDLAVFEGITLEGGTLSVEDASRLTLRQVAGGNRFASVAIDGDIVLGSQLFIEDGLETSGTINFIQNGRLVFDGTQTLSGNISGATGVIEIGRDATLNVATGSRIEGGSLRFIASQGTGELPSLVNRGTISANVPGGLLTLSLRSVTNLGTFEAFDRGVLRVQGTTGGFANIDSNGTLLFGTYRVGALSEIDLREAIVTNVASIELLGDGARLRGLETLERNSGSLTMASNSSLLVFGDLGFTTSSTFTVRVTESGDSVFVPLLEAWGNVQLGGRLVLDLSELTGSTEGTFRFIESDAFSGNWSAIDILGIDPSLVSFEGGPGTFTIVPTPGASSLLLALGIAASARRRR